MNYLRECVCVYCVCLYYMSLPALASVHCVCSESLCFQEAVWMTKTWREGVFLKSEAHEFYLCDPSKFLAVGTQLVLHKSTRFALFFLL